MDAEVLQIIIKEEEIEEIEEIIIIIQFKKQMKKSVIFMKDKLITIAQRVLDMIKKKSHKKVTGIGTYPSVKNKSKKRSFKKYRGQG